MLSRKFFLGLKIIKIFFRSIRETGKFKLEKIEASSSVHLALQIGVANEGNFNS